ncbi:hypothetical protein V1478_013070 [Vespula squamosa]|uniref:Uncharacterized protein n=1 Tax=Vespula squamosa TaxID=30214 RepID=A0ABD2ABZ5_VESSQ
MQTVAFRFSKGKWRLRRQTPGAFAEEGCRLVAEGSLARRSDISKNWYRRKLKVNRLSISSESSNSSRATGRLIDSGRIVEGSGNTIRSSCSCDASLLDGTKAGWKVDFPSQKRVEQKGKARQKGGRRDGRGIREIDEGGVTANEDKPYQG